MNDGWFGKMLISIVTDDWYILIFALLEAMLLAGILVMIANKKKGGEVSLSLFSLLNTLFTTFITIFPLLGMFGTVIALLGLDLTAGDMDGIRNNFFNALTSTAWGIVFSIIFKVVNACLSNGVESLLEELTARKNAEKAE